MSARKKAWAAAAALFASIPFDPAISQTANDAGLTAEQPENVKLQVYTAPKLLKPPPAIYPLGERADGGEGWVTLNFMVDPKGKPYEITVADSIGNRLFESSAIEGLERTVFQPATLGGRPVDAGRSLTIRFTMSEPEKGASSGFAMQHTKVMKAIDTGDKAEVERLLPDLSPYNFYEDAFRNMALYRYHLKWGTPEQQIKDLRRATVFDDSRLDKKTYLLALNSLLSIELSTSDFGAALDTWERMKKKAPKKTLEAWQSTIDQVIALSNDHRLVRQTGVIEDGHWFGRLFKNRFSFSVESGNLSEIKLRCRAKYVFLRYQQDVEYTVETKVRPCAIELIGDPGTRFALLQN